MTDLVRFLTDFVSGILLVPALVVLVFLTLYLPALIMTRLLFSFRRRRGPVMRFLSRPIGPPIPGQGADPPALRHALGRWTTIGLQTVSLFTVLLVIGSGYALFGVAVAGTVEIAYYTVMFAALFGAAVSAVECVCLLARLTLYGPRNRGNSPILRDDSVAHNNGVEPSDQPRPPLSRVRLAPERAGAA